MLRLALAALLVSGLAQAGRLTVDDVLSKTYPPQVERCRQLTFWADRDQCIQKAAETLPRASAAQLKACKKLDASGYVSGDLPGTAALLCTIQPAQ